MRNSSLNKTDKITIIYNTVVVIFVFIFRAKIAAYGCHLAFNLSVILLVLSLGLWNSGAPWNPKDSRDFSPGNSRGISQGYINRKRL